MCFLPSTTIWVEDELPLMEFATPSCPPDSVEPVDGGMATGAGVSLKVELLA